MLQYIRNCRSKLMGTGSSSRYPQKWSSYNIQVERKCAEGTVIIQLKPQTQSTQANCESNWLCHTIVLKLLWHPWKSLYCQELAENCDCQMELGRLCSIGTHRPQLIHNILSSNKFIWTTTVEKTENWSKCGYTWLPARLCANSLFRIQWLLPMLQENVWPIALTTCCLCSRHTS